MEITYNLSNDHDPHSGETLQLEVDASDTVYPSLKFSVEKEISNFEGPFMFKIVGYGSSINNIKPLSTEDAILYGYEGNSPIFSASHDEEMETKFAEKAAELRKDDGSVIMFPNSEIDFVCWPGSPCAAILPSFPNAPEIFFEVEYTVSNFSGNENSIGSETFCSTSTRQVWRVYNTPVGMMFGIMLALMSLLITFGLVFIATKKRWCRGVALVTPRSSMPSSRQPSSRKPSRKPSLPSSPPQPSARFKSKPSRFRSKPVASISTPSFAKDN
eukprot:TRINITY_DN10498_c0_g1_i2.p1 TRINITY_DN10498_c0_g1~~TRINITY_DN10498_c0_g1_i2.p1  ORF type:complete len:272 (+),score=60.45 TRINITY_DN10498_c0_g1_i2:140-955(+)